MKRYIRTNLAKLAQYYSFLAFVLNIKIKKQIQEAEVIFFFPFYHSGGAERVHLDIIKSIEHRSKYVFFTGKSSNNTFLNSFSSLTSFSEISNLVNSKYKDLVIKYLAKNINKSKKTNIVFGCNVAVFYELIPQLSSHILKIDLIHAFSKPDYGIEDLSINYVNYLDKRIVINNDTFKNIEIQYVNKGINRKLIERIVKIENGVFVPETYTKKLNDNIKVGFVGRGSSEKRPHLFFKIAELASFENLNLDFIIAGSNFDNYSNQISQLNILYKGILVSKSELENLYKNLDILIITSYREGFPMVVMEGMGYGVIPIVTNVGGLKEHINNYVNGFLIDNNLNDEYLVLEFLNIIKLLLSDKDKRNRISLNAYNYAFKNFSLEKMYFNYRNILQKKDT